MSSIDRTPMLARRAALLLAGALVITAGTAAAAVIVVRSNGPSAVSYPPGTKLPDNGTVVLKPGDTLTVLDAHGTRVLRGSGAGAVKVSVAGSGAATVNGVAALIAANGQRQTRTGATRGQNTQPRPTNVWVIDTTRSGTVCVADPRNLALWRPTTESAATLTLTRTSDGASTQAPFRAGQAVRAWPLTELSATDGAKVRIAGPDAKTPVTITLKLLPTVPATLDDTAAALLAQGCNAQLDLLIAATSVDSTS